MKAATRGRTTLAAALLVATAASPTLACSVQDGTPVTPPALPSGHVSTYVVDCVPENLVQEPAQLTLSCADANEVLDELHWSDWGEATATATGALLTNTCEPTCADGTTARFPVEVRVGDPDDDEGTSFYRSIVVTPTDDLPPGWDGPLRQELPGP